MLCAAFGLLHLALGLELKKTLSCWILDLFVVMF